MDNRRRFLITAALINICIQTYQETKDFDSFVDFVIVHKEYVESCMDYYTDQTLHMLNMFEKTYAKELEVDHEEIYRWKILKADVYERCKKPKAAFNIRKLLLRKLEQKRIVSDNLLFDIAERSNDIKFMANLFSALNESEIKFNQSAIYFRTKIAYLILQERFEEADKVFHRWNNYMNQSFDDVPPIHLYKFLLTKSFFLYKKGDYNAALMICDQISFPLDTDAQRSLISIKALIDIALGNFSDVERLYNESLYLDTLLSMIFSFVKFQKHDFAEAMRLLSDFDDDDMQNISWLIRQYAELYTKFKETRSSENSNETCSSELLIQCLSMKSSINKMFKEHFDGYFL